MIPLWLFLVLVVMLLASLVSNAFAMRGWKHANEEWKKSNDGWARTIAKAEALQRRLEPFKGYEEQISPTAQERLQILYYKGERPCMCREGLPCVRCVRERAS